MIIEAVGRAKINLRKALSKVASAENTDGKITRKIVRVELVKKDAAGNVVGRVVNGND